MKRADEGMGFLLRYENVAWYEDGAVRILDRRIYPVKTEYVICTKHEEVAKAIGEDVYKRQFSDCPALAAGCFLLLSGSIGRFCF